VFFMLGLFALALVDSDLMVVRGIFLIVKFK
jgi:hypothetical protein